MAEQVLTPLCRAAWTQNVFTPKKEERTDKQTGQVTITDKYGCQLVFDQSVNEGLQAMMDAAFRVGQEAFGDNFWALVQQGSIKWPFRNGAEINPKTGQPRYEAGTTFINCSSGTPIDVVSKWCDPADPQRKPIKVTDPSQLWPGQYVKAAVTFKAYKRESWGVGCYINGLQLHHTGERWGDSFDAQSAFNAEGEAPTGQFGPGPSPQSAPPATTPNTSGAPTGATAPTAPPAGQQPGAASVPNASAPPPAPGAATTPGPSPQPGSVPSPTPNTTPAGPTQGQPTTTASGPVAASAPTSQQPLPTTAPTAPSQGSGGSSLL